jgi:hypothetical protein
MVGRTLFDSASLGMPLPKSQPGQISEQCNVSDLTAALHCTALQCTALHCTARQCVSDPTAQNVLYPIHPSRAGHSISEGSALQCSAVQCSALHCTTLHCTALQRAGKGCREICGFKPGQQDDIMQWCSAVEQWCSAVLQWCMQWCSAVVQYSGAVQWSSGAKQCSGAVNSGSDAVQ